MPKPELVLAVIRQESEFDQKANSSAGARGMMQLMTYTAKLVAKQAKLTYAKSRLTKDPNYNIKLGSFYLASLFRFRLFLGGGTGRFFGLSFLAV